MGKHFKKNKKELTPFFKKKYVILILLKSSNSYQALTNAGEENSQEQVDVFVPTRNLFIIK